jgi:hypothetical protein
MKTPRKSSVYQELKALFGYCADYLGVTNSGKYWFSFTPAKTRPTALATRVKKYLRDHDYAFSVKVKSRVKGPDVIRVVIA